MITSMNNKIKMARCCRRVDVLVVSGGKKGGGGGGGGGGEGWETRSASLSHQSHVTYLWPS